MSDSLIREGLTFDDVLLAPGASDVLPADVDLGCSLTREISLNTPLVSAAMDTVTEYRLAIAIAQEGGIGIIHKSMSIDRQAQEVRSVKKYESGVVKDPIAVPVDPGVEEEAFDRGDGAAVGQAEAALDRQGVGNCDGAFLSAEAEASEDRDDALAARHHADRVLQEELVPDHHAERMGHALEEDATILANVLVAQVALAGGAVSGSFEPLSVNFVLAILSVSLISKRSCGKTPRARCSSDSSFLSVSMSSSRPMAELANEFSFGSPR